MQELEATWSRVLSVWWLVHWRAVAGGLATGLALGALLGLAAVFADWNSGTAVQLAVGAITSYAWTIIAMRMALRKKYRDFRIVLLPRDGAI
jgi:hypothetical protein